MYPELRSRYKSPRGYINIYKNPFFEANSLSSGETVPPGLVGDCPSMWAFLVTSIEVVQIIRWPQTRYGRR